jgi:hypothetical protein
MANPGAANVATVACRLTGVQFLASIISCGLGAMNDGTSFGAVMFAMLLFLLALATLNVWITAWDSAGDDVPPSGYSATERI